MTLWDGDGSLDSYTGLRIRNLDPALFVIGIQDDNKKKVVFLIAFIGTFTPVFKDNKAWGSHKTLQIKFFLNLFGLLMEGFWSVQIVTDPDPGGLRIYESYGSGSEFGSAETFIFSVRKVFCLLMWYFWSRHPKETLPTRVRVPFPVWSARSLFVGSGSWLLH